MNINYKIGDTVRLISISKDDEMLGRYIGEEGVYQGKYDNNSNCCYVHFPYYDEYLVNYNQIEFVKPSTVETIFKAFNKLKRNEELINRIKDFIETKE